MKEVTQNRIKIYGTCNLSTDQMHVLSLLYAPIITPKAMALYMMCYALLERSTLHSPEYPLDFLYDGLSLTPHDFSATRHKLEATGLCETYLSEDFLVIKLFAPLTAEGFIKDSPMAPYLKRIIGEHRFNDLIDHFRINHAKMTGYTPIGVAFDDVFEPLESGITTRSRYLNINRKMPIIEHHFDADLVLNSISSSMMSSQMKTKRMKQKIAEVAYLYSLDELSMQPLIRASLTPDKMIDFKALQIACERLYQNTPKKAFRKKTSPYDLDYLTSVHPKQLLMDLTGLVPTVSELDTISKLLEESGLKIEVINVLIAYVLKSLDNHFPAYNYFGKVVGEWKRNDIDTADQAIIYLEKKVRPNKTTRPQKAYKKKDKLDTNVDWFDAYLKAQKEG